MFIISVVSYVHLLQVFLHLANISSSMIEFIQYPWADKAAQSLFPVDTLTASSHGVAVAESI